MPPGRVHQDDRRKKGWLNDPQTHAHYERERRLIEQIDAVIHALDQLRVDAGISKAELARRIGRNPSSIRRLFTAQAVRPELPLIVSIADELGARVEITARAPGHASADLGTRPRGDWSDEEIARDSAVATARARRDRRNGAAANVVAAGALARFANRVAEAAELARRDERARS
jgi:transcriptional regulator with XRE-family HTH domain